MKGNATAFCIKLADVVFDIEPMFSYLREYCVEYIVNEPAEEVIQTKPEDIAFERERSVKEAEQNYSDAYLETLAVYRNIAERMLAYDTLLFHGSVIAVDGMGYLFTAKSGTGKSTHTRLWRERFGNRAVMVNDDKPLLKVTEDSVIAYGTPWDGKHRLSNNIAVPLKAICILTRSEENHIEEISPGEAYQMLLQQTYRPKNGAFMLQTLELIDRVMKNIRFYRLGCNMSPEAARVAFEGMNGEKTED